MMPSRYIPLGPASFRRSQSSFMLSVSAVGLNGLLIIGQILFGGSVVISQIPPSSRLCVPSDTQNPLPHLEMVAPSPTIGTSSTSSPPQIEQTELTEPVHLGGAKMVGAGSESGDCFSGFIEHTPSGTTRILQPLYRITDRENHCL
jgi:hypothetical protein